MNTFARLSTLPNLTELYLVSVSIDLDMIERACPVPMYSMRKLELDYIHFEVTENSPVISYYRFIAEIVPKVQELSLYFDEMVIISLLLIRH